MSAVWQEFCRRLGIRFPIIQDGMGPGSTTELAVAVSRAGGLGTVSTPSLTMPDDEVRLLLRERIERVASAVGGPFAVNVPVGTLASGEVLPATDVCIQATIDAKRQGGQVGDKLVALTTSAGFPGAYSAAIKDAGLIHIAKVGSVRHALKAVGAGADVIIASGHEMGGHTHVRPVHTMVLAPQVIAATDRPVVVSGGIFDGRGLAAVLAMGGAGVAMGTRFIATVEHEWHLAYKQAIVDAPEWSDLTYQGFYAPTRALANKAATELYAEARQRLPDQEFDRWKEQSMRLAQSDGDVENGLIVAGQCAAAIKDIVTVPDLLNSMMAQAADLLGAAAEGLRSGGSR